MRLILKHLRFNLGFELNQFVQSNGSFFCNDDSNELRWSDIKGWIVKVHPAETNARFAHLVHFLCVSFFGGNLAALTE